MKLILLRLSVVCGACLLFVYGFVGGYGWGRLCEQSAQSQKELRISGEKKRVEETGRDTVKPPSTYIQQQFLNFQYAKNSSVARQHEIAMCMYLECRGRATQYRIESDGTAVPEKFYHERLKQWQTIAQNER